MRRSTLNLFAATAILAVFATAASASWQEQTSAFDQHRLASLAEAKARGLDEAKGSGGRGDASAIHSALDAPTHAPAPREVAGSWRCRTIKLGGMTPYMVYGWFPCRISDRGGHLYFERVGGTQHMRGWLYPGEGGMVYLGASSVKGEAAHAYSGNGASAGASATPDDQIGLLTAMNGRHARLEMPYPVQESTYDVIELKR